MLEKGVQILNAFTSIALIAGIYLVLQQLEAMETDRLTSREESRLNLIYAADIGLETFHEISYKMTTNQELTPAETLRAEFYNDNLIDFFNILQQRGGVEWDEERYRISACRGFNNDVGRAYLEKYKNRPHWGERITKFLNALNKGCDDFATPEDIATP